MKRLVYFAALPVLALSFVGFTANLDRYPLYYVDEPYFNYPALQYLAGHGLTYRVSARAPHIDAVYAMHGPFYPWLQVLTFRLFGATQFACRFPGFLGGYLAIAALGVFLARRGLWGTAAVLTLAWVGDRASQEILIGRMDGLALFFLAIGMMALVRALESGRVGWAVACGGLLGTAVGFHPACIYFVAAALALLAARAPAGRGSRLVLGCILGGLAPAALFAWCWSPHLAWAIEQFRWASRFQVESRASDNVAKLMRVLYWSRYWWAGLVAAVAFFLVPVTARAWASGRPSASGEGGEPLRDASAGFSIAGLIVVLISAKHPYYLVYFTTWPLIALGALAEAAPGAGRRVRAASLAIGAWLFLAWTPSLLWNAMRARETMLYRDALDPALFARKLADVIPADAEVTGSPELFLIARRAGLNFTPLPWFRERARVPVGAWVVLSEGERSRGDMVDPGDLSARRLVFEGDAFPGAKGLEYPFSVFGPARARR